LAAVGLVVAVIFLYFFSFFVSLTVYSVHRDVQSISFDTYWNTLFKDAALKVFFLYLVLAVLFYIISFFGFAYGFVFPALVLNFIISLVVMFCVQSIVLNEASLGEAVVRSAEFWLENPFTSAAIFVVASVLLFIIVCIELFLDLIGLPGMMVSFILSLVFLVPFIEQTKSYAYLLRTDLLRSQEITHAHAPKFTHAPHVSGTRLRERPKHGSKL
jgi:hypothetical protein